MTTEPIASEFYWLPCKEQRFFTRIQENELEQGMTILYKPVMTKQEEIEVIQNTIRQLQENVERLKSESPEDKFKRLLQCTKMHETKESILIEKKVDAFRKALWVAEVLNRKGDSKYDGFYTPYLIDGKPSYICSGSGTEMMIPNFKLREVAVTLFDYLTDDEIELLYGQRIER